jgi:hypothetical protein
VDSKFIAIKTAVDELAAKIGAPHDALPTYGYTKDFAYPHIEVDQSFLMHFVVIERGKEIDRRSTANLDTLLYWVFDGITFSMASKYEVNNRVPNQDTRRLLFAKQEELLESLKPGWGETCKMRHQEILINYPFNDSANLGA